MSSASRSLNRCLLQVWPFLLQHYAFSSSAESREELDAAQREHFERSMCEWMAIEAIVKQRDKEHTEACLVKASQESTGVLCGSVMTCRTHHDTLHVLVSCRRPHPAHAQGLESQQRRVREC